MSIKNRFYYEDGNLYYKESKGKMRRGQIAGSKASTGYRQVMVDGKAYLVHRVIWFLEKGEWPIELDHINRDRTDNRIENLREVSHKENMDNRNPNKIYSTNKSGIKGVSWHKASNKWAASSGNKWLGTYNTIAEAAEVLNEY